LGQYNDEDDIVFGVTVSGRSAALAEIETRVGLFINTLPLRVKIHPDLSWENWLQELQQTQTTLERNAYTPDKLLETWCDVPAGKPLFNCNLRFQNYPANEIVTQPASQLKIGYLSGVDLWHYPFNLVIVPGTELQLFITYNLYSFETSVIRQVLQKLEEMLSRFTDATPGDRLKSLMRITT
jgi:non-ribosomal peptide synthetase component F